MKSRNRQSASNKRNSMEITPLTNTAIVNLTSSVRPTVRIKKYDKNLKIKPGTSNFDIKNFI